MCTHIYKHDLVSACRMPNEISVVMLSSRHCCLESLCLAVFIYCQAEADLQFSLYQILSQHRRSRRTREKPWRGVWEENQHIWVWLKPSKHSQPARSFFLAMQPIVQSTWKKIFYIFSSMCYLHSSGPWGLLIPPQNEVWAWSRGQTACSIEIRPPMMRSSGETNFLKGKGNRRIMADNICGTSKEYKCALLLNTCGSQELFTIDLGSLVSLGEERGWLLGGCDVSARWEVGAAQW